MSLRHELRKLIFSAYLLFAASITLFPVQYTVGTSYPVFNPSQINLVPFKTICQTIGILGVSQFSPLFKLGTLVKTIGGNLLLLLPLGFMLPHLYKMFRTLAPCLLAASIVSCVIEIIQFVETSYDFAFNRAMDIDDVLLNVMGALIGFLVWRTLRNKYCDEKGTIQPQIES